MLRCLRSCPCSCCLRCCCQFRCLLFVFACPWLPPVCYFRFALVLIFRRFSFLCILVGDGNSSYSKRMEVHFAPELQATLDQLVLETGRTADTLLADAMAGYVSELAETRAMLDSRYDDIKSGKVALLDGEEAFALLMARTEAKRNSRG